MIKIEIYNNGYKIIGHAEEKTCHQVSLWHWIASNMILGLDKNAQVYETHNNNPDNPNEGLSWIKFNPEINNLRWIFDDFIVSAERWAKEYWGNKVQFQIIEREME